MDSKPFDRAQGADTPAEVDLVESFAQGRVNRRDFLRRGSALGLSIPFMGAVLAACGGDDDDDTSTTDGATEGTGGPPTAPPVRPGRRQRPGVEQRAERSASPARSRPARSIPVAMQDLGTYGIIAQCFEFLCTLGETDIAPGLAESWEPNDDGSVWTFNLRQGVKWHDGTDFTSADVAATMDRLVEFGNSGLKGVIEAGAVDATDPTTAVFNARQPERQLPVPRLGVQRTVGDHTGRVRARHDARRVAERHRAVQVRRRRLGPGDRRLVRAQPGLVGRRDPARRQRVAASSTTRARWSRRPRPERSTPSSSSRSTAATRCSTTRTSTCSPCMRRRTVRSGCAATKASSPTSGCVRRWRCRIDRDQLIETLFRGQADIGNDHVIAPIYPFFSRHGAAARPVTSTRRKALLEEAGVHRSRRRRCTSAELQEIPELAQLIKQQAAEAGITLELAGESLDTFYGAQWCPAEPADPPCSGAAELGIVDYGHRATPDVYLNAALSTGGVWNSSQYSSPELRRRLHRVPGGDRRRRPDGGVRRRSRRSSTTRSR